MFGFCLEFTGTKKKKKKKSYECNRFKKKRKKRLDACYNVNVIGARIELNLEVHGKH